MGPVLIFRGREAGIWRLSATLVLGAGVPPGALVADGGTPVQPHRLARLGEDEIWRYDFAVPLQSEARDVEYRIGDERWRFRVPAVDGRLRLAFTACNGMEVAEPEEGGDRNERWRHLEARHAASPFNLLLHGGDQIYADALWEEIPELRAWQDLPRAKKLRTPISDAVEARIRRHYHHIYQRAWTVENTARLLACIPSLMMWDDHDIVDGWGSHSPGIQHSPAFRSVWRAAREAFALFQLGGAVDALPRDGFAREDGRHFGWGYRAGHVGIIAPDLRSTRTQSRVMDVGAWRDFLAGLDRLRGCRHLLLLSSVPAINADPSFVERLLRWLPGVHSNQDDFRDQWQSYAHRKEWRRLLRTLVAFSRETGARVTALSGEIHMACLGRVSSGEIDVHQLTSSGIVHPAPPWAVSRYFEFMARRPRRVARDLRLEMLRMPGRRQRYLTARNWLELDVMPDGGLAAAWHAEGVSEPLRFAVRATPHPSE